MRARDIGQVFHIEVFVVPQHARARMAQLEKLRRRIIALDWKVQDVVVVPVPQVPEEATGAHHVGS